MRAQGGGAIPGFYFRALAVLDAAIEQTFANKAGIKKMSSTNAKAFNSIRQRLKKHFRDAAMAAGRRAKAQPDSTEDEASDSDSDSDSSDDEAARAEKAEKRRARRRRRRRRAGRMSTTGSPWLAKRGRWRSPAPLSRWT